MIIQVAKHNVNVLILSAFTKISINNHGLDMFVSLKFEVKRWNSVGGMGSTTSVVVHSRFTNTDVLNRDQPHP